MNNELSYEKYINEIKKNVLHYEKTGIRSDCPVTTVFIMLQGKWKNHILFEMSMRNVMRFGELGKVLPGITNTMLTTTLRELEGHGLINRRQFNEIPPHVEYSLTEKGKDLMPIFHEMYKWGEKYYR